MSLPIRVGILVALGGLGCQVNPYKITFEGDAGVIASEAGAEPVPDMGPDLVPDANCVPTTETCNGLDDDCNGVTDDIDPLNNDPFNCGSCGNTCFVDNSVCDTCSGGVCSSPDVCCSGRIDCIPDQQFAVNGVTPPSQFQVAGDQTATFTAGTLFACRGSTANDGNYTVASSSFAAGNTTITVGETIADATADGTLVYPTEKCETACIPNQGGVETCNGRDDNCDCQTDEGFDLLTDVNNCGACGHQCVGLNSTDSCVGGQCVYTCDFDTSSPTGCFADILSIPPGCEYQCPVCPPSGGVADPVPLDRNCNDPLETGAPETLCNGIDDDCDGCIDDGNPGGGAPCGPSDGECVQGTFQCVFGSLVCGGGQGPVTETCNNLDDDCDGVTDNGFDKQSDPRYCGDCTPCVLPNAFTSCNAGVCTLSLCHPGFVNADGIDANGCEYACTPSTATEIACDGIDDDCDTLTDSADPDLVPPVGLCNTLGACAGTVPTCAATTCDPQVKWRCLYSPPAETDSCQNLVVQETLCDGFDNDCDGVADDNEPLLGQPCDDGNLGICKGTGTYVCQPDKTGIQCNVTTPGQPSAPEVCDNLDNNCNGVPDDGAPDTMVHVVGGGMAFWIDSYEASRPDATSADAGTAEHRSCSNPDVVPWTKATWTEADQACTAAGYRLCTEAEWQEACEGAANLNYPYGMGYDPQACNGADYDPDCSPPDDDMLLPTGTAYGCPPPVSSLCVSAYGAFDMSGNAKEWTATQVGSSPVTYRVRGGAYDNVASSLTCQFDFLSNEPDFFYKNLGFRCCSDVAP
jgi:sulfatase-modifying factor enzyme 1/putative metal-binding protein